MSKKYNALYLIEKNFIKKEFATTIDALLNELKQRILYQNKQFDTIKERIICAFNQAPLENPDTLKCNQDIHTSIIELLGLANRYAKDIYINVVREILLNPAIYIPEIILFIKKLTPDIYNQIFQSLNNQSQNIITQSLLTIKDTMLYSHLGRIGLNIGQSDNKNALLIASAYKSTKSYDLNSVVFENIEEFNKFVELMKKNFSKLVPVNINFIIPGNHWISGKISMKHSEDPYAEKEEKKDVRLLIMDPLLPTDPDFSSNLITKTAICFPSVKIYQHKEKMQNSSRGCQIFALFLGLLKISSIENRSKLDVFSYIEKKIDRRNAVPEKYISRNGNRFAVPIYNIILPLPLLALSETTKILDTAHLSSLGYTDEELNDSMWSKSGLALPGKWINFFENSVSSNKQQNIRLETIFNKLIEKITIYCMRNSDEEIEKEMYQFSGEAYIEQLRKKVDNPNNCRL